MTVRVSEAALVVFRASGLPAAPIVEPACVALAARVVVVGLRAVVLAAGRVDAVLRAVVFAAGRVDAALAAVALAAPLLDVPRVAGASAVLRAADPAVLVFLAAAGRVEAAVLVTAFLAVAFLAVDFLAVDFLAVDFLAVDFVADCAGVPPRAADFTVVLAALVAVAFFAVERGVVAFLAAAFVADRAVAAPRAARPVAVAFFTAVLAAGRVAVRPAVVFATEPEEVFLAPALVAVSVPAARRVGAFFAADRDEVVALVAAPVPFFAEPAEPAEPAGLVALVAPRGAGIFAAPDPSD